MAKSKQQNKNFIRRLNARANYEFLDTAYVNNETYYDYLDRFKQIALAQFEWINLPESMNAEFLEKCLYYFGEATFLYTNEYGFINTKCCANGKINIYGLPTSMNCFSYGFQSARKLFNGFEKESSGLNDENACILIKNNFDKTPTAMSMELFAYRLYEAERTCDVNIKTQKFPTIFAGNEDLKLFFKNLAEKYEGNEWAVFIDKKQMGEMAFRTIKTEAPYIADKLQDYKKEIFNEALTYLGIDNIHVEKKERLVTGEANSNNELINLNLQSRLASRKLACKQFNSFFGLTGTNKAIDVKLRSDLTNVIKKVESIVNDIAPENNSNNEGGEENG